MVDNIEKDIREFTIISQGRKNEVWHPHSTNIQTQLKHVREGELCRTAGIKYNTNKIEQGENHKVESSKRPACDSVNRSSGAQQKAELD